MKKVLFFSSILLTSLLSKDIGGDYVPFEADCVIIKEENSIICKYSAERSTEDRYIDVEWINPKGESSRNRKILFPSGHGSIYDFRYLDGRMSGLWTFNVIDGENKASISFEVSGN